MAEFIVPISRDDLLKRSYANHFYVSEVASFSRLGAHLSACQKELGSRGHFMVHDMFDYFYSVLHYWNEIDNKLKEQAWDMLLLSCKKVTPAVVEVLNKMDKSEYSSYRKSVKMNVYLLIQFIDLYEMQMHQALPVLDKGKGKKKKPVISIGTKIDWPHELQTAISAINQLFQCHIHNLWDPPTIEDDFINLVANICYKLLENPDTCKNNGIREGISKILINLVKRHNHTRICAIKLVGLLHSFPHTVSCVLSICRDFIAAENMSHIIREIIQDICVSYSSTDLEHDNQACNSFTSFLSEFASEHPNLIIPVLPHLKNKLHDDPYSMRNCVLAILGEVIIKVFSGDKNQNANRDSYLDMIEERVHDNNGFVRAKALNILLLIVENNKMPLSRQARLMKLLIGEDGAIFDASSMARKNAMRILTCMTNQNPAKGVPYADLNSTLEEEKQKLQDMEKKLEELPECEIVDVQRRIDFIQEQIDMTLDKNGRKSLSMPIESPDVAREHLTNEIIKLKGVIYIMEQSIEFYDCIQSALGDVQSMLSSKVTSDVLEAVSFFINAKLAGIDNVDNGVRKMLSHICSADDSIKTAVSKAYRRLYLETEENDERDKSTIIVDSLTSLLTEPNYGEMMSIERLITTFIESKDINEKVVKVLWKRFNSRSQELTVFQKKAAVIIFCMVSMVPQSYMMQYFHSLINDGIPSTGWSSLDLQMVDYMCRSMQNIIKAQVKPKTEEPFKLSRDHPLFERLINLSISTFSMQKKAYWIPMVNEVLATIYLLSENPDFICSKFITSLASEMVNGTKENADTQLQSELQCPTFMITRFLAVSGELALKQFIHFDVSIQDELKRRNLVKEETEQAKQLKQSKSKARQSTNLEEEIGLAGASADDGEAEYIRLLCDNHLISDESKLLHRLLLFVEYICRNASKYNDERLQTIASLSLGKMMLISSREFTDARIGLLFDIARRSPSDIIRANLIVPLGDLIRRFTLKMEPYTKDMYGRLRDSSPIVRLNALNVLSHLILNDMIKVKGWISEITTCIIDEHPRIVHLAKIFFQDLANKDKALFNVMPDIISRLSDQETGVSEDKFRTIMEYLMPFIQKKNQFENLFDKILVRFNSTNDERAWRDMSYCLSLMNYNDYMIKALNDRMGFFAGKLHVDEVYNAVSGIINNAEKNAKGDMEGVVAEMSVTLKKLRDKGVEDEEVNINAVKAAAKKQKRSHKPKDTPPPPPRERLSRSQKRPIVNDPLFSDEEEEEEPRVAERSHRSQRTAGTSRRVIEASESEEEDEPRVVDRSHRSQKKVAVPRRIIEASESESEEEDDDESE